MYPYRHHHHSMLILVSFLLSLNKAVDYRYLTTYHCLHQNLNDRKCQLDLSCSVLFISFPIIKSNRKEEKEVNFMYIYVKWHLKVLYPLLVQLSTRCTRLLTFD